MSDKRFPATEQRLRKARRDGKVVKSRLVTILSEWLLISVWIWLALSWVKSETLIQWLKFQGISPVLALKRSLGLIGALLILSVGGIGMAALVAVFSQTRGSIALKQVVPDLARIGPGKYLRRIRDGGMECGVGMIRVSILAIAVVPVLITYIKDASQLMRAPRDAVLSVIGSQISAVLMRCILVLGVFAFLGYALARWRFYREQRMSFEEIREEFKENEGDPHMRAARRQAHHAMVMAEIEKRVRNAKVIVVRRRPVDTQAGYA